MKFNQFKNKIATLVAIKLDSLEAQFKLDPKRRLQYDTGGIKVNNPRKAAVLVLFYPDINGETNFLLTERAIYKGTHSAQISFPGGKRELTDENLRETALRESFEEVGVPTQSIEIIRELTDVYIAPSNFLVTPFMGFVTQKPSFIINYEVATTIDVLLEDLLNEASLSNIKITTSYMDNVSVPCFKLNSYTVWGATAMMLSEIKELLKH